MHLVITDSGLGGLTICAGIEQVFRQQGRSAGVRLTYVNAWPEEGAGYKPLPDMAARAEVFDRALASMDRMSPDRILIACNTLSILYAMTDHRRRAAIPVQGIVDAGVRLFAEAMREDPSSSIVLIGTKTTIQSRAHLDGLLACGISPDRVTAVDCHGLATAIEADPDGQTAAHLIETCTARACAAGVHGDRVLVGLCCTHYGYVAEEIRRSFERQSGRVVRTLDPNARLVEDVTAANHSRSDCAGAITPGVIVMSKVVLDDRARRAIARRIEPVSAVTARALLSYTRVPNLF